MYRLLEPYNIEQFTTVMDVKEAIDCNWKVVMDAFEEGYHINGIHPQLLAVLNIDPKTARYQFFENHSVAVAPFEVRGAGAESRLTGSMALPQHSRDHRRGDPAFSGTDSALPGQGRGSGVLRRCHCPRAASIGHP